MKNKWFILVVVSMMALTGCQSLMYFPQKEQFYSPSQIGLKEETVFFKSSLGDSIHGWFFKATKAPVKGTIVFFHGNAENITTHFVLLRFMPSEGYNYLIFDYPGYGLSSGKPTPESTVASGVAALKFAHEKYPGPLYVYGHSLGGAIALRSIEETRTAIPVEKIVIDGSFDSYKKVARTVLAKRWWTWWLQPMTYLVLSDKKAVSDLEVLKPIPTLYIVGDKDPVVPMENTMSMFERAPEPKKLIVVPGGSHGNLYFMDNGKYIDQLLSFLVTK